MRGRAVHRVFAAEEQPTEAHDCAQAPPAWRIPRQSRALAMALLGAAIAFVAVLAVHALSGGPRAVIVGKGAGVAARSPHSAAVIARAVVSPRAPGRRTSRNVLSSPVHAVRRGPVSIPTLRSEQRAVVRPSNAGAFPAAVAGTAASEFNFER
jgi:hypothetical protein